MERKKLNDLCEVLSSKRIFASDYKTFGIPFFRGKEVTEYSKNKQIIPEFYISEQLFLSIKNKYGVPSFGDILITSVGTLGSLMYVDEQRFYFKDGNLIWLRNFNNSVESKYIYYLLSSNKYKQQLVNSAIGSTQKAFTIEMIKAFEIPVPALEVQQHIVNTISFLLLKSL